LTDAYRIAWSILRDRSAAEDAAQEACARAWGNIKNLRRPSDLPYGSVAVDALEPQLRLPIVLRY
jgi:hypothetical protein